MTFGVIYKAACRCRFVLASTFGESLIARNGMMYWTEEWSSLARNSRTCAFRQKYLVFFVVCLCSLAVYLCIQLTVAWVHQRWEWHTSALSAVTHIIHYKQIKVCV